MSTCAAHQILIIDDDHSVRSLLERFCRQLGYATESAPTGEEGLQRLHPSVDLVLLDFNMPGINGMDVLQHIRHTEPYVDLPVIMITGNVSETLRIRALEAGVNAFVLKPFDLQELKAHTASLLLTRQVQVTLEQQRARLEQLALGRTEALQQALAQADRTRVDLE